MLSRTCPPNSPTAPAPPRTPPSPERDGGAALRAVAQELHPASPVFTPAPDAAAPPHRDTFGELVTNLLAWPQNERVLVVPDGDEGCGCLVRTLEDLGCTVVVAPQPLDAIVRLQDAAIHVSSVLVPIGRNPSDAIELLAWMEIEHPDVRRLAYDVTQHPAHDVLQGTPEAPQLNILANRWGPLVELFVRVQHYEGFASPDLHAQVAATPTNQALLNAWQPPAPLSFRDVERRYSVRIQSLAGEMGFGPSDAADIAQETFLRLFAVMADGAVDLKESLVGHLVAESMGGRAHGNRRRERLLSACRQQAAGDSVRNLLSQRVSRSAAMARGKSSAADRQPSSHPAFAPSRRRGSPKQLATGRPC